MLEQSIFMWGFTRSESWLHLVRYYCKRLVLWRMQLTC